MPCPNSLWKLLHVGTLSNLVWPNTSWPQRQGVCSSTHTFHTIHLLHRLRPAVSTVHVAHGTTLFFSRTQQFPGERGHGQDSEDHGSPAEPLHGVSVLSVTHIQTMVFRLCLCSYKHILGDVCFIQSVLPVQVCYLHWTRIRITTTIRSTSYRVLAVLGQSGGQHVCDTWLTAGCPVSSRFPHTLRLHLLQRRLGLALAGHLVKNASRSTVSSTLVSAWLAPHWPDGIMGYDITNLKEKVFVPEIQSCLIVWRFPVSVKSQNSQLLPLLGLFVSEYVH